MELAVLIVLIAALITAFVMFRSSPQTIQIADDA
jgi:hypothetical protein